MMETTELTEEVQMGIGTGGPQVPLVDRARLGDLLRGARHAAGYSSQTACVDALSKAGFVMTAWTLGAIERGEKYVEVEELVALTLFLAPRNGINYFLLPAMPADDARRFAELNSGE